MRRKRFRLFIGFLLTAGLLLSSCGPTADNGFCSDLTLNTLKELCGSMEDFPFSFSYNGKLQSGFGKGFRLTRSDILSSEDRERVTLTFLHKKSGADFVLHLTGYRYFDAVDWYVEITGQKPGKTGVFSDLNACDLKISGFRPTVSGLSGDGGETMYLPYRTSLEDYPVSHRSESGRPTHGVFPYYNLNTDQGGCFLAVGWPGTWRADFTYENGVTRFTCGQNAFAAYLKKGETVRTPLVARLSYGTDLDGDRQMNLWRKWMIDCNMPTVDGNPIPPQFAASQMGQSFSTEKALALIERYKAWEIPLDTLWVDAGWYRYSAGNSEDWTRTGSYEMDPEKYPDGLASVGKAMEETGGRLLLWFEPEVVRDSEEGFLAQYPDFQKDWFLGTAMEGTWLEGQLVNLGDPACKDWVLSHITDTMKQANAKIFRIDFNVDPAGVWAKNDGDHRKGYTENQYVQGYLSLLDGIREQIPGVYLDSCASGGGRNDLESMRRAVPLHISDFWDGNSGGYLQRLSVSLNLSQWFPYFKLQRNVSESDMFTYRYCYAGFTIENVYTDGGEDTRICAQKAYEEWKNLTKYLYSDFYPLCDCTKGINMRIWKAWEYFDREGSNSGVMMAFRPENSGEDTYPVCLKGLDPAGMYKITDSDTGISFEASGEQLMKEGIPVTLPGPCTSAYYYIESINA